jgi:predicted transcriptional regulator
MTCDKNILDLEVRQELYKFVSDNPGLQINKISQTLNMPLSTLDHHLKFLLKSHLMKRGNNGSSKKIFICNGNGYCKRDKELINLLRQEIPCRIFLHLIFSLPVTTKELAEELRIHSSDVYIHIKKLLDIGAIEPAFVKDGKIFPVRNNGGSHIIITDDTDRERYYIIKDQKMINDAYKLIIKYKDSLQSSNFINNHIALLKGREGPVPKEAVNFATAVNYFIKELEEMFPSPFHL